MSLVAWASGAGLVAAIVLGLGAFHSGPTVRGSRGFQVPTGLAVRLGLSLAGAVVLGVATGWPVAAAGGATMGYFAKELLSPKAQRQAPIERTEAIAVWTEQLRDTMAAAAGLQQAIVATAHLAPDPIRAEIERAAASAVGEPLPGVLRQLADDLADPTADLVVTALVLAASGEAQGLGEVLSTIAVSARDDVIMRRQVDASRARTRTAVRTITVIALITLVGLLVAGHGYLTPYAKPKGQFVLALVLACYGGGVAVLHRMGRERSTERILSRPGSF
jgi:tight adherence protein B